MKNCSECGFFGSLYPNTFCNGCQWYNGRAIKTNWHPVGTFKVWNEKVMKEIRTCHTCGYYGSNSRVGINCFCMDCEWDTAPPVSKRNRRRISVVLNRTGWHPIGTFKENDEKEV